MFDALASVAGTSADAVQKVAVASLSSGAKTAGAAATGGAEAGGKKRLFRKTRTTILRPGVYPLFKYDSCDQVPKFLSDQLVTATVESVSWDEVTASDTQLDKAVGGIVPTNRTPVAPAKPVKKR